MPWIRIPLALGWNVSEPTIRRALHKAGFARRSQRAKPPISEKNRKLQLQWAQEHVNWTVEGWKRILWTDETWVTGGIPKRVLVTHTKEEEWDPTCVVEKIPQKKGWMFWGSFSAGLRKGPCLVWEKEWGTINKQSYVEHVVPLIEE